MSMEVSRLNLVVSLAPYILLSTRQEGGSGVKRKVACAICISNVQPNRTATHIILSLFLPFLFAMGGVLQPTTASTTGLRTHADED
jgi:hypothetical protein